MVPAIIDRSPLIVSVASNGTSPVLSRQIRTQLETSIPHGMGKLAEFSGKWRNQVKEKFLIQMSAVYFGKTCMQALKGTSF